MQLERRVRIETGEKLHQHLERGKGVVRVGKFEYAVSGHVHTNWLGCRNFFYGIDVPGSAAALFYG